MHTPDPSRMSEQDMPVGPLNRERLASAGNCSILGADRCEQDQATARSERIAHGLNFSWPLVYRAFPWNGELARACRVPGTIRNRCARGRRKRTEILRFDTFARRKVVNSHPRRGEEIS